MKDSVFPWFRAGGKKPLGTQIREIHEILSTYRRWPGYYFRYRAYLLGPDRAAELMPPRLVDKMRQRLNDGCDYDLVVDKRRFRARMEASGIPVVREILSKYAPDQILDADSQPMPPDAAAALLRDYGGELFVKPLGGSLGRDAFIARQGASLSFLQDDKAWIVQERLRQHPDLETLYPGSINTLRVVTTTEGGVPHFEMVTLRIGAGGSWIDNAGSGGLAAPVDIETGRIGRPATRRYEYDPDQTQHAVHPDTGTPIVGFEFPFFREALDLVTDAAKALPELSSVGWDIAVLPDGPVLIEANGAWSADLFFRHYPVRFTRIGQLAYETYVAGPGT